MRKFFTLIFFFLTAFTLFAQTLREAKIYVPPVGGIGYDDDNAFFYKQLTHKIVIHKYRLAKVQRDSQYVMKGSIEPFRGYKENGEPIVSSEDSDFTLPKVTPRIRSSRGRQEFFSWEDEEHLQFFSPSGDNGFADIPFDPLSEEPEFVFKIELEDSVTGDNLDRRYIVYKETDASIGEMLSILVKNMLANIQDVGEHYDWRDKWLFLDIGAFFAPTNYSGEGRMEHKYNLGFRGSLDFHFADFMSLGMGSQLVMNNTKGRNDSYDMILEAPFAMKFVFKPGNRFMMEPYAGVSLNFSLSNENEISPYSWFAGFLLGTKCGVGMLFADTRFASDFFKSRTADDQEFKRYIIQIAVGYRFTLFRKPPRMLFLE